MDATIALAPEIVVVAGDVFHSVRPSNPAILLAFQQFSRLRQELPDTKIIMVAGNHDTPRSAETGMHSAPVRADGRIRRGQQAGDEFLSGSQSLDPRGAVRR